MLIIIIETINKTKASINRGHLQSSPLELSVPSNASELENSDVDEVSESSISRFRPSIA